MTTIFDDGYYATTMAECFLLIDEQGYLGRLWIERAGDTMEIVYMDCEHSVCLWNEDDSVLSCQACGLDCT